MTGGSQVPGSRSTCPKNVAAVMRGQSTDSCEPRLWIHPPAESTGYPTGVSDPSALLCRRLERRSEHRLVGGQQRAPAARHSDPRCGEKFLDLVRLHALALPPCEGRDAPGSESPAAEQIAPDADRCAGWQQAPFGALRSI